MEKLLLNHWPQFHLFFHLCLSLKLVLRPSILTTVFEKVHGLIKRLTTNPKQAIETNMFGAWRSLVAHLVWDQGVASSNLAAPTISFQFVLVRQRG